MTQKELLYVEDAIKHENNMIAYLEDLSTIVDDKKIVSFLNLQIKNHFMLKEQLIKELEVLND